MELYELNKNNLKEIKPISFSLEKDIQLIVEDNTKELFNLEFVKSEFTVGDFRIDTLCFDKETRSFVIIEYKNSKSSSVFDQCMTYLNLISERMNDFLVEYNEINDTGLKRSEIDWGQSKIIIISPSFNKFNIESINIRDINIELYEVKLFDNNILSFNPIRRKNSGKLKNIIKDSKRMKNLKKVSNQYDLDYHFKKTDKKLFTIFGLLMEKLEEFDDINFSYVKSHISLKKKNKVVCYFGPRKSHITIHIIKGYQDYKKEFLLKDPEKIFQDKVRQDRTWGPLNYYEYKIIDDKYLDYIVMLLKQKYNFV